MSKLFQLNGFDFFKGAIVSIFVAILTYIQQSLTESSTVNLKVILITALTALVGYLIKQLMTDQNGSILKTGGRKRRKKKTPKGVNGDSFEFDDQDFDMNSVVFYTSDLVFDASIEVSLISPTPNGQWVTFSMPIQYTDLESLYFEIETD